jgi:hypothetical protein
MRDIYQVDPKPDNASKSEKVIDVGGRFVVVRACSSPFECLIENNTKGKAWKEKFDFKDGDEFTVPDRLADFNKITLFNRESDQLEVELSIQQLPFRANDERIPPTELEPNEGITVLAPATSTDSFNGFRGGRRRQWAYIFCLTAGTKLFVMNDGKEAGCVGCVDANAPGYLPLPTDGNLIIKNAGLAPSSFILTEIFGK